MNTSPQPYRLATIFCWLFLGLSVLVLCYVYYRAEIIHAGAQNAKFIKYYRPIGY